MNYKYDEAKYGALDRKAARYGNPIRSAEDLPIPLSTGAPDAKWDARLQEQWWYNEATIQKELEKDPWMNTGLLTLHKKLLSFGGVRTVLPVVEDDLRNILERGQLWLGRLPKMMPGQPSQCHRNSCACWKANKSRAILCTGYALSEDGLWRQHSWLVAFHHQQIVETTVPRVAYFGFAMTTEEAENFCAENY